MVVTFVPRLLLTANALVVLVISHYLMEVVGHGESRNRDCSLQAKSNGSGHCACTALLDIHCKGLDSIPEFLDTGMTFNGIYMANQAISDVPQGIFAYIRVNKIVLNFNPIGDKLSDNALRGLERILRELYVGDCGIRSLPVGMLNGMEELRHLHLWANQITAIPTTFFKDCTNLQELILWGNQLREIDENSLAGLWKLRKLDLDRNLITDLRKDAFRHLSELEAIHLGENLITTLSSDTFSFTKNLKILNLDGNRITHIYPKAFDGLGNLLSLALDQNNITYFAAPILDNLRNLTTLNLQKNRLEAIWPRTFGAQRSLVRLNLSNNRLSSLPDDMLKSSPRLRYVYLENNQIATFSRCVMSRRVTPRTVSLLGNPVRCSCDLSWLTDLSESKGLTVWGTCASGNHDVEIPTSVVSRQNYVTCNASKADCRSQW